MIPVLARSLDVRRSRVGYGTRVACVIAMVTVAFTAPVRAARTRNNQPPSVSITSPTSGATFQPAASIDITANASDPDGSISRVDFYADQVKIGSDRSRPYVFTWTTATAGTHVVTAVARDNANASTTSAPVTISVTPTGPSPSPLPLPPADTTAPSVSITAPTGGTQVSGSVIITANASDNIGVSSITVLVDGVAVGSGNSSPLNVTWNASSVAQGSHTITARAVDAAGNTGTSAPVAVSVVAPADTTAPTASITSPANGAAVTGTVAITASASDNVGVTSVTILVDGASVGSDTSAPYSVSWNTAGVTAGSHTIRAQAKDAAGNIGTSGSVSVTVTAPNQPPTISLTAPASGGTYTTPANITVSATAADADGTIARVDFYVGTTLISSDTTSPYAATWTTSTAGAYSFSAKAVDNTGATTPSSSVSVTVTSPAAAPTTAHFSPSSDDGNVQTYRLDIFPSTVSVTAATPTASDDLGKPPLVNGEYVADISSTVASLPAGSYVATVSAVATSGTAQSAPSPVFSILGSLVTTTALGSGDGLEGVRPETVPDSSRSRAAQADAVVWASNSATGLVAAFDATSGDLLGTVAVGLAPAGIAAPHGGGAVYVANEGSDTVSVIDKASMTVAATIALPAPSGRKPRFATGSPDGSAVYIGEAGSNVVDVIETATNRIARRFAAAQPGSTIRGVVTDSTGEVIYSISAGDQPSLNTLAAIESSTGRWLWAIGLGDQPGSLTIGSDDRVAFVAVPATNSIRAIDLAQHAFTADINLGSGNAPAAIQLSENGELVVTLRSESQSAAIVDGRSVRMVSAAQSVSAKWVSQDAQHLSYVGVMGANEDAGVIAVDPVQAVVVRHFRFPGGGVPGSAIVDAR